MKIKLLVLSILIGLLITNSKAQNPSFGWAKSFGGFGADIGNSITMDAMNNVYIAGFFQDTVDFNPGIGVMNLISNGMNDIFVQKLDAFGNLLWVKSFGGSEDDIGWSITTDVNGNVFVTGIYRNTVDFDPGPGIFNLSGTVGYITMFVLMLDSSGNFVWAKSMGGGNSSTNGFSIISDKMSNIYVTGCFYNTTDFNPGIGITNLSSNGYADIFVIKLDVLGNFKWAKSMGGIGYDYGYSIATDTLGNICLTGCFQNTVDFDPNIGVVNAASHGNSDFFIEKLDSSGNLIWVKTIGGNGGDIGADIITDSNNNIYITGSYMDTVDFDPGIGILNLSANGSSDIYMLKLNSLGNLQWAKTIGGLGGEAAKSITLDYLGNIYITGTFWGNSVFDPDSANATVITNGVNDIFLLKLNNIGNFCWVKSFGSSWIDRGNSITADSNGNVYLTGEFFNTIDFNPDSGVVNLSSNGNVDYFVLKYCQCDIDVSLINNGITITANETGATYQWLDCNSSYAIISGATNQSYTATTNGNYAVEITKNGCVDTSICYSITNIGIIENSFGDEFKFYPNPTEGKVNLEFGSKYKEVQLILRNSEGKLIKQEEFKNKQKISLEIEGSKGIYLLEVISGEGERAVIRVVKQ
ncbi:MAG: SBBP repeat-containing protein [Saprospiraceae bacterium]|nr:SBBP repeat-containing protein [Saprospiraceae bacterium]